MTVPAAPLPNVASLIRALPADASPSGNHWLPAATGRKTAFFSRGSMALAAAAAALRAGDPSGRWRLWIPEYFCEEALGPVRHLGIPLSFYPVKEDLSPDLPEDQAGPGAILLVHYFGFPNNTDSVGTACRKAGLTLIEDAAHVLIPHKGVGVSPWVIYSPRKLLALPSGGLLVLPEEAAAHIPAAMPDEAGETAHWVLRRLTQSMLRTARIPWHKRRAVSAAPNLFDPTIRTCSPYALRLLKEAGGGLPKVAHRRRENFRLIGEWTADLPGCRPMHPDLPEDVCPYAYPLRVGEAQRVTEALQACGVPAYRWPDLPPEAQGSVARLLAAETVLLPIHQSLLPRELEQVRASLLKVLS